MRRNIEDIEINCEVKQKCLIMEWEWQPQSFHWNMSKVWKDKMSSRRHFKKWNHWEQRWDMDWVQNSQGILGTRPSSVSTSWVQLDHSSHTVTKLTWIYVCWIWWYILHMQLNSTQTRLNVNKEICVVKLEMV